jgi:DNA primase
MPRISDTELERLKEEVSVERLVEASGVELKKAGKDFLGRCPFHDDAEASLVVTAAKNLWHCFGWSWPPPADHPAPPVGAPWLSPPSCPA